MKRQAYVIFDRAAKGDPSVLSLSVIGYASEKLVTCHHLGWQCVQSRKSRVLATESPDDSFSIRLARQIQKYGLSGQLDAFFVSILVKAPVSLRDRPGADAFAKRLVFSIPPTGRQE